MPRNRAAVGAAAPDDPKGTFPVIDQPIVPPYSPMEAISAGVIPTAIRFRCDVGAGPEEPRRRP